MKRCPECRRDYYDDTLLYCLDDGNALLEGPASGSGAGDEPVTAILHETGASGDAPTLAQINTTNETAILPSGEIVKTKGKRTTYLMAVGGLLVIVAAAAAGWYFFGDKLFAKRQPFAKISSEELFTGDIIGTYTLSPDGKLIAYFKRAIKEGKDIKMVVVRQLGSGAESVIREVEAESNQIWIESFSPDGEYIYFTESSVGGKPTLYKTSTLGGSAQKILEDMTVPKISPDGKKIAFKRPGEGKNIYWANIDGSGQEIILAGADINAGTIALGGWSPDSTKLSMWYWRSDITNESGGNDSPYFVAVLDTAVPSGSSTDRVRVLIEEDWPNDPSAFHWAADGHGLIFLANKIGSPLKADIFYLSYPGSELRQLTDDAVNYLDLQVAADGTNLIVKSGIGLNSLWSLDPKTKVAKRLTSEDKTIFAGSLSTSNDGRLFYLKRGKGSDEFYSMKQDGTDQRKLFTRKGTVEDFDVTSDGKYFFVNAWPPSGPGILLHRMDIDGSNEIQLTDVKDSFDINVRTTANGSVWFARQLGLGGSVPYHIMRMPVSGGKAEKVEGLEPAYRNVRPVLSPDEKHLAYIAVVKNDQTSKSDVYLRIVEMNDGVAGKKILETNGDHVGMFNWTPDSSAIVFERDTGRHDLFKIDIASKTETQISEFDANIDTGDFVWSQDGTNILMFKFTGLTSIVRIKDMGLDN
jgi:Tol biopolymer transport system component